VVVDSPLFYRLPFESGRWQAVGSVLWARRLGRRFPRQRSLHDQCGVMYRFGAR